MLPKHEDANKKKKEEARDQIQMDTHIYSIS